MYCNIKNMIMLICSYIWRESRFAVLYLLKYKYKLHDDIMIIIQRFTFILHDLLLDIDYVRILMTQKYRFQYKDISRSPPDEINQRNCRRVVFQLSEESVMQIERYRLQLRRSATMNLRQISVQWRQKGRQGATWTSRDNSYFNLMRLNSWNAAVF